MVFLLERQVSRRVVGPVIMMLRIKIIDSVETNKHAMRHSSLDGEL